MMRIMLRSKIHRARVTDRNLEYEGSLTLDRDLMDAVGLLPHEQVHVYNVSNGARFETYVIPGEPGSGTACVNGAAAHLVEDGHIVIVASYCLCDDEEAVSHAPRIALVDEGNRIVRIS